ncbi:MAG: 50S ribosomal protein L9 [Chloroflexi bacterium]|nr:MAG: 50S ribosomal protein L9 [Chloroflexota bacterium]
MKVLLLKDVYKLGRAGDVKRVADGFGRNFLLPQGLAVLATPGALKQAEHIRERANEQRSILNKEMSVIADKVKNIVVMFPARASETGKLYGSITTQMIADAVSKKAGVEISRRQIDSQPLRSLGEHELPVRLTVDLVPTIRVIVFREGEAVRVPGTEEKAAAPEVVEAPVEAEAPEEEEAPEAEEAPTEGA